MVRNEEKRDGSTHNLKLINTFFRKKNKEKTFQYIEKSKKNIYFTIYFY